MSPRQREAPELEAMLERMLRALVRRCGEGELEALEALRRLELTTKYSLSAGVRAYRASPVHPSWRTLGRILGMSGQGAQQRFGGDPVEELARDLS